MRADVSRTPAGLPSVGWEVEVPLFNLTGTLVIHERPDGAEIDLVDGDFSPGKLIFTATPRAARRQHAARRRAAEHPERGLADPPPGQAESRGRAGGAGRRLVRHAARRRAARGERRHRRRAPARGDAGAAAHLVALGARPRRREAGGVARARRGRAGGAHLVAAAGRRRGRDDAGRSDAERARAAARSGELARVPRLADDRTARRSERHGREGRGQPAVRRSRGDVDGRAREPAALDRHRRRDHAARASAGRSTRSTRGRTRARRR